MRVLPVAAGFSMLLCAVPCFAQDAGEGSTALRRFVGREVRVLDDRGVERRGTLAAASADGVRLLNASGEVIVPTAGILRVDRRGDSLKEGFILGMLWPAVMWPLGAAQGADSEAEAWAALPLAMALWGGVGAGLDGLHKGWTTVYRGQPRPQSALGIVPARGGVRVAYVRRF